MELDGKIEEIFGPWLEGAIGVEPTLAAREDRGAAWGLGSEVEEDSKLEVSDKLSMLEHVPKRPAPPRSKDLPYQAASPEWLESDVASSA